MVIQAFFKSSAETLGNKKIFKKAVHFLFQLLMTKSEDGFTAVHAQLQDSVSAVRVSAPTTL